MRYYDEPLPDIRVGDVVRRRDGRLPPQDRSAFTERLILLHREDGAPEQAPPVPWSSDALERFAAEQMDELSRAYYVEHGSASDLERLGWRIAWMVDLDDDVIVLDGERIAIADAGLSADAVARTVLGSHDFSRDRWPRP